MISRRISLLAGLASGLALSLAPATQAAAGQLQRFSNFHGASCQVGDPETQHVTYGENGMMVKSTNPSPISAVCSMPWSQDLVPLSLQKITVSLEFSSAPVGGGGFTPGCFLDITTLNGGGLSQGVTQINNPGTATPEYVWIAQSSNTNPLPAWGTVVSSALYCQGLPAGVVITGYTINTCLGVGC
jgi:hypothetical protein